MWAGAIALAILNFATLALAGRPWGITSAFALWGAKSATALGVNVASWPYWHAQAKVLTAPLSFDITTVMDIGIMVGAFAASVLAGRFDPVWRLPLRSLAAAVVGGLLLGYGARLSYGCNIGSYFSGIVSGSSAWLAVARLRLPRQCRRHASAAALRPGRREDHQADRLLKIAGYFSFPPPGSAHCGPGAVAGAGVMR